MTENNSNGEVTDYKKRRIFPCPHCANPIEVVLRNEVEVDIPNDSARVDWKSTLTPDQLAVIESVEKSGVLKSFEDVVRRVKPVDPPKNISRFFMIFLKTAAQKRVSAETILEFKKMFSGKNIEFWSAQGLGVVIVDKQLRAFFPLAVIAGKSIRAIGKKSGSAFFIPPDKKELSEIIRTRFGFVNGKGIFFDAMRKKSIGDFARPSL